MRITIWDLDYYFATDKKNIFNPDAMRISSYHKQKGDQINFVTDKYDINRPYDIYYIFKENTKTPNPPVEFLVNDKVRWMGKAYRARAKWKMPDIMMAVRPDYLLYPEKNTIAEKSEQLRLFNNKAQLLPIIQDYSNTFSGRKRVILTDEYIWYSSKKDLIKALDILAEAKYLTFSEPIWIQKIISDKDIKDKFLSLKLTPGAQLTWQTIHPQDFESAFEFLKEVKGKWPRVAVGPLPMRIKMFKHWDDYSQGKKDFLYIQDIILKLKKENFKLNLLPLEQRLETPYFFMFETLSDWTCGKRNNLSWLEYLMGKYKMYNCLNKPESWPIPFRELLRQTYTNKEFLLLRRNDNYYNENDIPWALWDETFKLGL